MLYPNFKELLSYEAAAKGVSLSMNKKLPTGVGNFLSAFKGQGMEFDEIREYVYGDDVRDIEWRASARGDATYVKTYHEERHRNIVIAIDNNSYMKFGTRGTFRNVQAARAAALLGFAAHRNQDKVGIYVYGGLRNRFNFFRPVSTKRSLISSLKLLSEPQPETLEDYSTDGAIFNLRRIGANPNIMFVISDLRMITPDTGKSFYSAGRKPELIFINITDDNDSQMPDVGNIIFEYEGKRFSIDTSARRGMERYRKIYAEKRELLDITAKKLGARVIDINTRDDVAKTLIAGLKA